MKKVFLLLIVLSLSFTTVQANHELEAGDALSTGEQTPSIDSLFVSRSSLEISLVDSPQKITRAELAKFLVRSLDLYDEGAESNFSDVPVEDEYYHYISSAVQAGFMLGVSESFFLPDGMVTRAQYATLLVRALGYPFTQNDINAMDVPSSHWASMPVRTVLDASLMSLYDDGTFRPNEPLTLDPNGQLLAKVLPVDVDHKGVLWSSNNPDIAKVDKTGYVSAVSTGDVVITAKTVNGEFSKLINVTVKDTNEQALELAIKAIERAEESYDLDDVERAKKALAKLSDRKEKVKLQERLNIIIDSITITTQMNSAYHDFVQAQEAIKRMPAGEQRTRLQEQLDEVKELLFVEGDHNSLFNEVSSLLDNVLISKLDTAELVDLAIDEYSKSVVLIDSLDGKDQEDMIEKRRKIEIVLLASILERKTLSEKQLDFIVLHVIKKNNVTSIKDMREVRGQVQSLLNNKVTGKEINEVIQRYLN